MIERLTAEERAARVRALRHAAPYLKRYRGRTLLIKAGGAVVASEAGIRGIVEQIAILHHLGIRVVFVHGGGPQGTELAEALGIRTRFVAGRRVTDADGIRVMTMAMNGEITTRILAACRALDLPAIGFSGVSSGLVQAVRRPPVEVDGGIVDYGLVGDIEEVRAEVLTEQLGLGVIPIISPLSADRDGRLLNINADTVAASLGQALKAEKLILLGETAGLLRDPDDPASVISFLDLEELDRLARTGGIRAGMRPKARCITEALRGGVVRAHLIPVGVPDSLLLEVFTPEGIGTLVVSELSELSPAERERRSRSCQYRGAEGG